MLCVLLLGVVQLAVVVRDQLAVQFAAREAAARCRGGVGRQRRRRGRRPRAVARCAPLDVRIERSASGVTATASFVDHTDVPLIGALLPDVRVSSTATMQWEPP